jgi:hypothetical protein
MNFSSDQKGTTYETRIKNMFDSDCFETWTSIPAVVNRAAKSYIPLSRQ